MKFWKELRNRPFCNDFHFIAIAVIISLIAIKYWYFYIILILYFIFILKKTKYIIPILIISILTTILTFIAYKAPKLELNGYNEATVVDINDSYYILRIKNTKIKAYSYNKGFSPGDVINVKLELTQLEEKAYDTDFDYKEYLYSDRIYYQGIIKSAKLIKSNFSIYKIKYEYKKYLKNNLSDNTYSYVMALAFAENNLDDGLKEGYSTLGISHILAISGMHIMLMYKLLCFCLIKIFHTRKKIIPITIISIYVFVIGFPSSALRALLFLIIKALNGEKSDNIYTDLDIISMSFIIMVFISPLKAYQSGFILSYLVSFILIFSNDLIKCKNRLLKGFLTAVLIYFLTLPISAGFYGKISITALFTSPLLSNAIAYILLPICYILSIIPALDVVAKYLFEFLNNYVNVIANNSLTFTIPYFNFFKKLIYYFFYGFLLYSIASEKRRIFSLIIYLLSLIIFITERNVAFYTKITFISVGQGDSILIELPHNKGIILIDTYNSIDYIRSEGISKIDYLIVTHSDSDHIGGVGDLINSLNVGKIIYPIYDEACLSYFSNQNYLAVKSGYFFNIDNIKFKILGPVNEGNDLNSNSLVVQVTIENYTFLFCGDMTVEEENDLIKKYDKDLKSDALKVGHHGSLSSTSKEFLNLVRPKYSIISVGLNNSYGLPDEEVVDDLSKISAVYMTSTSGNIDIYLYDGKLKLCPYR